MTIPQAREENYSLNTRSRIPIFLSNNNNNKHQIANKMEILNKFDADVDRKKQQQLHQQQQQQQEREVTQRRKQSALRRSRSVTMTTTAQVSGGKSVATTPVADRQLPINLSYLSIKSTSSSLSSLNNSAKSSSSSSSWSIILGQIEKTTNLYDLVRLMRKYLKKVDKAYSIDTMYEYLKTNLKYNGYRNFTLDSVQQTMNSNQAVQAPVRSMSQLRINHNLSQLQQKYYDLNGRNVSQVNRAGEKLLRHMKIFKRFYAIIQRDLLAKILPVELQSFSNELKQGDVLRRKSSAADHNQNHSSINRSSSLIMDGTLVKNAAIVGKERQKVNVKMFNRLRKYHRKLFDLNEKLNILVNDHTNCDLKLLSYHSSLPSKYDFYKHGEYLLRLLPDIVYKIRITIKLCEKFFSVFNGLFGTLDYLNVNGGRRRDETTGRKALASNEIETLNEENEDDEDVDADENESLNGDDKGNSSVLKMMPRRRDPQHEQQKQQQAASNLPRINSRLKLNKELTAGSRKDFLNDTTDLAQVCDTVDIGPYAAANTKINSQKKDWQNILVFDDDDDDVDDEIDNIQLQNNNKNKSIQNDYYAKNKDSTMVVDDLTRNDSFIQETDCSSIFSDESRSRFDDSLKQQHHQKTSSSGKQLKSSTTAAGAAPSSLQQSHDYEILVREYNIIKEKIEQSNRRTFELNGSLMNLVQRAERCARLEEQIKSDKELIRKTENSIKFYSHSASSGSNSSSGGGGGSSGSGSATTTDLVNHNINPKTNEVFKMQLEKQLEYLKYRFKLNLQDLNIEQMCAPEISSAIVDTEYKLAQVNLYVKELNKYLHLIETKLKPYKQQQQQQYHHNQQIAKNTHTFINTKTATLSTSNMKKPFALKPKTLPPLQPPPSYNQNLNNNNNNT